MRLVRVLHSCCAWILVIVATLILGPLAILLGTVAPSSDLSLRAARLWGRICLWVAGIRLHVEGTEQLAAGAKYVIMANHESSLDIPTLLVALPLSLRVRFLAKASLFSIPVLGRAMRSIGFVPVNREDGSTATEMFGLAMGQLRSSNSLLVFPEATRTPDGRLLPFHRGGFLIALRSGTPILPVGLEGPRLSMPDRAATIRPMRVVVRIGVPIASAEFGISGRRELTAACRRAIDRLRGDRGHIHDSEG